MWNATKEIERLTEQRASWGAVCRNLSRLIDGRSYHGPIHWQDMTDADIREVRDHADRLSRDLPRKG